MPRIAGVDIPRSKQVWVSLQHIYGIGPALSRRILSETDIKSVMKGLETALAVSPSNKLTTAWGFIKSD